MSQEVLDNILVLYEDIVRNRVIVTERMEQAGIEANPLVAESLAKYWTALERLSAE